MAACGWLTTDMACCACCPWALSHLCRWLFFSFPTLSCACAHGLCATCAETWILTKKMMREGEQRLAFTVPIFEPLPSQYYIRIVSDQVNQSAQASSKV